MTAQEFHVLAQGWASTITDYASGLLGSTLIISFASALAGAYAGAAAAQRQIERSRNREELLKELRSTNAAVMVSFTICNTALGVKKQLVLPLYERFIQDRAAFLAFLEQRRTGQRQGNAPFVFTADLHEFQAPVLPTETLKHLVFDRISAFGKPLGLVSLVENAAIGLGAAVAKRSRLIERFAEHRPPESEWPWHYFGERLQSGHTHKEYADLVEVMHSYTNDVIFFSAQLCGELVEHGKAVRTGFNKRFGKGAPHVSEPDFSGPRKTGLFPPESDYSSWLNWVAERKPDIAS